MLVIIQLSERQEKIIDIVKNKEPITSEAIANELGLTRATLRPDLAILTMSGILDARPKVGYFYIGKNSTQFIADRIKSIIVDEVKSLPVVVDEETSIYDAIVLMFLENVGSIYVTDNGYLSGVVSRKDFLKSAIGGIDLNKMPIGMIMTRMPNIVYVKPDDNILEAGMKLMDHEIDSLPVVEEIEKDKKYKVLGRVTKTNITRIFVELGGEIMNKELTLYVLSDSIGETGELLSHAALSQFNSGNYNVRRFPFITNEEQIVEIFNEAKISPSVVIYTIVIDELRSYVDVMGEEYGIPTVDLMSPALEAIEKVLEFGPKRESGLIRKLDENYFKKVEAVEFAVKYDDGKDSRGIKQSDIVLVGVSRTSKTPLSMYLAHKNFKVANVPLVPEVPVPKELFENPVGAYLQYSTIHL